MLGIRPAELHPIVVHFPIALLITSVVLDVIALFARRWHLVYGATWLLAFGVVGVVAAGLTGTLSEHAAHTAAVSNLLSLHQTLAVATGFVFAALLVMRLIWLSPRLLAALQPRQTAFAVIESRLRTILPGLWRERLSLVLVGVYLTGSLIGVVLLALTGYLGGALVYDHGVGTPTGFIVPMLMACA